ncbi:unnamed protein product [Caenorhabditis sp. 36 PRJEB53466]|nr:unnamed protein product [Caenorhabditis sp. 36 PRJEB53466]
MAEVLPEDGFDDLSNTLGLIPSQSNGENSQWANLSDQDVLRIYFLLSTAQSKSAMDKYFDLETIKNEAELRRIISDGPKLLQIKVCSACAEDVDKCSCSNSAPSAELVFADLEQRMTTMIKTDQARRHEESSGSGK